MQSGVLPESLPVARICIKMVELVPNRLTMILSGIYYTLKGFFNHMTIMDLRIWNCVLTHSNYVGTVAKCSHTWFLNTVQIRFITTMQLCLPIIAFICSFEVDLAHIIRDLIKSEIL